MLWKYEERTEQFSSALIYVSISLILANIQLR